MRNARVRESTGRSRKKKSFGKKWSLRKYCLVIARGEKRDVEGKNQDNGTEISFPNTFENLITAGRFADAIAEAYQFALERRVTNKIFTEVE